MSYEKATIHSTLSRIQNNELVLPAIQRDFVWEPERMYKLLDSIFRGYPFSTLLFWNTKQRVQFREFTKDWSKDYRYTFQVKEAGKKGSLVLDGQQRLQTLYLALYGSYEQKILYFDLLSGRELDDISQAQYHFEFMTSNEVEERNSSQPLSHYWIPLRQLITLTYGQVLPKAHQYLTQLGISAESEAGQRLINNISTAHGMLKAEESLNYFTIDKEYGDDGIETDLEEILEIFVRVNSGGQVLSKSDLMFSLMQMLWENAADSISELIDQLNSMGRFEFDKDFILKTALVCTGAGAKYEVNKLRNENTVKEIELHFDQIANALIHCVEFLRDTCRIVDDRILRSYNTLIPFVFFFYLQPNQEVKGEQSRLNMNRALYLSLMTSLFSHFADNYIDQLVRDVFKPRHEIQPGIFPLDEYLKFLSAKTGQVEINDWLLQTNITLLMNILDGGTRLPEGKRTRRPEVDHIFPKSKLLELGFSEDQINHYANFRLIPAIDNNWKRNKDPQNYFIGNTLAARRYLVPIELLKFELYPQFLQRRRELIWQHLERFFGSVKEDVFQESSQVQPAEIQKIPAPIPSEQPVEWMLTVKSLLNPEEQKHPIVSDKTLWVEVYRKAGFNGQWSGRYHWALYNAGIHNVGEFAAAVMVLKIKITHYSYDLPFYQFACALPDGKRIWIPTREFGGYAWKHALKTLEQGGVDWKKYLFIEQDGKTKYLVKLHEIESEFRKSLNQDVWKVTFNEKRGWHQIWKENWLHSNLNIHFEFSYNQDYDQEGIVDFMVDIEGSKGPGFIKLFENHYPLLAENYRQAGILYRPKERDWAIAWKRYLIPADAEGTAKVFIYAFQEFSFLTDSIDTVLSQTSRR